MTSRIAIVVSFISIGLMACFAEKGPPPERVAKGQKASPNDAGQAGDSEDPEGIEVPEKANRPKFEPPPAPTFPPPPTPGPAPRVVKQSLSASVGLITVELTAGKVERIKFMRKTVTGLRQLEDDEKIVVKVRILNEAPYSIKYTPWHSIASDKSTAKAKDEHNRPYPPWSGGVASWPVGGVQNACEIAEKSAIDDVIAFDRPTFAAEEIDVRIPASNLGKPGKYFDFKVGRKFFEDESKRKDDVVERFERAKREHAKLVEKMKQDHEELVAKAEAKFKADEAAWAEADRKRVAIEKEIVSNGGNVPTTYTAGHKTVFVKGYTRKDGTVVAPHTRSAPRR